MSPFDIAAIIAEWRKWRWSKIVGPTVGRIEATIAKRDAAKRQKRAYLQLDRKIRSLRNQQIRLERAL